MPYPQRILQPDSTLVRITANHPAGEDDHTGITTVVWTQLYIGYISSYGPKVGGAGVLSEQHVDWEKLHLYRILVIRKGRSRKPGRSWEVVERHYLHKINMQASVEAWEQACFAAIRTGLYKGHPDKFIWENPT